MAFERLPMRGQRGGSGSNFCALGIRPQAVVLFTVIVQELLGQIDLGGLLGVFQHIKRVLMQGCHGKRHARGPLVLAFDRALSPAEANQHNSGNPKRGKNQGAGLPHLLWEEIHAKAG